MVYQCIDQVPQRERWRCTARMSGRAPPGTRSLSIRHQASASGSADSGSSPVADPGAPTVLMRSPAALLPPAGGLIPGSTLKTYPDAAHGFLFQHHAEFADDVLSFLD